MSSPTRSEPASPQAQNKSEETHHAIAAAEIEMLRAMKKGPDVPPSHGFKDDADPPNKS